LNKKAGYLISKKDDCQFYLINFHPAGKPEAFICCVIKGWQSRCGGMASPLSALHMKASDSCKIEVKTSGRQK
jgi:hypothetical protein